MTNYVITIARGFGSGGKDIGVRLSKELGIPCYENQLLKMASDKTGINESLFKETDEKLRGSKISQLLNSWSFNSKVTPAEGGFVSDAQLFGIQSDIIRELALNESCIIIGKCADFVLKGYDNVLSLYIEAPRAICLKSIIDRTHVTEAEAHRMIEETDKYRAEYYKYYTKGNYWTNPVNYDMTLNTGRLSREQCVKIIRSALKEKFGI